MKRRKVIQIAVSEGTAMAANGDSDWVRTIVSLCDDGTMWVMNNGKESGFERLPPIPQDEDQ